MTFSPNGELLVSTYGEPLISVWSVSTGAELQTLTGPTGMVHAVSFSPDGAYLITADDTLRLWGIAP